MLSSLTLFDDFFDYRKPSVYVISDAQMSEWKTKQAHAEIIELNKLIDAHEQSIERLKNTRSDLEKAYPALQPKPEE